MPILFLDLEENSSNATSQQPQKYAYSDEDDSTDEVGSNNRSTSRRSKKFTAKKALKTCSEDCLLKLETNDANYIDLKIISWNDSAQVEIRDNNETSFEEADLDSANSTLRAVSRWDSSEHKSTHLNQITPVDKIVYLTLKLNVKMKVYSVLTNCSGKLSEQLSASSSNYSFINLAMRKRICVHVSLNSSLSSPSPASNKLMGLGRFKNIMGSTTVNLIGNIAKPLSGSLQNQTITSTSLTYRVIASVPSLLTEVENRESLAIKAATSITEDLINELSTDSNQESPTMEYKSLDSSIGHLEHYANTIEAVDTILKRDRAQQKIELKKLVSQNKKKSSNGNSVHSDSDAEDSQHSEGSSDSSGGGGTTARPSAMKKTFSVPNLIKNLTIHQAKESSGDFKDLRADLATSETTSSIDTTEADHSPQSMQHKSPNQNHPANEFNQVKKVTMVEPQSDFVTQPPTPTTTITTTNASSSSQVSKASLEIIKLYDAVKKEDDDDEQAKLESLKKISEENEAKIASLIFQDFSSVDEVPKEVVFPSEEPVAAATETNTNTVGADLSKQNEFKGSVVSLDTAQTSLDTSLIGRTESNLSISSTLTNSSQKSSVLDKSQQQTHTKSQQKLNEDEFRELMEALADWVKLDAHVIVSTNSVQNKRGHIRYIGATNFGAGVWIGVELEQKFGKNDGRVKDKRYFTCPEDKGVFVRVDKLSPVVNRLD